MFPLFISNAKYIKLKIDTPKSRKHGINLPIFFPRNFKNININGKTNSNCKRIAMYQKCINGDEAFLTK